MSTQTIFLTAGATSKSVDISLVQKAAATSPGDPLTGLAFNSSGLQAYYRKGATGTLTAITLATQTVGGAYSSGGFVELSGTNAPGVYRFDIPDTVIATAGEANIFISGHASLAAHQVKIVVTDFDLFDRSANLRKAITEVSQPATGSVPTPEQILLALYQERLNWLYSGSQKIVYKLDGVTIAYTINLNSSGSPSGGTRA